MSSLHNKCLNQSVRWLFPFDLIPLNWPFYASTNGITRTKNTNKKKKSYHSSDSPVVGHKYCKQQFLSQLCCFRFIWLSFFPFMQQCLMFIYFFVNLVFKFFFERNYKFLLFVDFWKTFYEFKVRQNVSILYYRES